MHRKKIWILPAIISVLVMTLFTSTALAADNPVSLDTSSIADGQNDVPLDASIELTFTNNVVNASVKENNAHCFELLCGDEEVAIDVVMADDQIHPEQKRIITVVPKQVLQKGKKYSLMISGNLTAKNGNSIGSDTTISFTTEGAVSYIWYIAGGAIVVSAAVAFVLLNGKHDSKKEN